MILLVDNYDSFTYNLYQYLSELGARVAVRRNDAVTVGDAARMKPERIVISPGPGRPEDAGVTMDLLRHFVGRIPILGVCLGHQALAATFGGRVVRLPRPLHGKTSLIHHDGQGIYRNAANPLRAARYHSLIAERQSLPACFEIASTLEDGTVMGIRHKQHRVEGVQFHPESIMTAEGRRLLQNFLEA
jgi:anthranilate synthase/aminodeoxychorismate synthase-like glutamine amidotransferase